MSLLMHRGRAAPLYPNAQSGQLYLLGSGHRSRSRGGEALDADELPINEEERSGGKSSAWDANNLSTTGPAT